MKALKDYIIISFGVLAVCLAFNWFYIPSKIVLGGLGGVGIIISKYYPYIAVGQTMLVFNALLFFVAFIFIGNEFAIKTIYGAFLCCCLLWFFEKLFPVNEPVFYNPLFNVGASVVIDAIGCAVIFKYNASTGGIDVVARLLNKYFNIKMGTALTFSNIIIVLSCFIVFGWFFGILSFVARITHGYLINLFTKFVDSLSNKSEDVLIAYTDQLDKRTA